MARFRLGFWVGLALCGVTQPAAAFCRTSSCELGEEDRVAQGGMECKRQDGCVTEGNPLHWASPCLVYAVQRDGSPKAGISADAFQVMVAQAFAAWENAACPGGGSPRFHAQFQGLISCNRREAVCGGADKNVNAFMFHDTDWPAMATTIGLTRPTGGTTSGLVIEADLEINTQDFVFMEGSNGSSNGGALDLSQVLAHEVGHFLGLSHSNASGALMASDYASLQLSRELLTDDDIAAICTAYPPGDALNCAAPPAPAYDECQVTPGAAQNCVLPAVNHERKSSGGCSVAPGPARGSSGSGYALLLALVALRRVRPLRSARQ